MIYVPLELLLIEDNAEDESLALRALRGCGLPLSVRVARDGERALRALGLLGGAKIKTPDLVISDLKLPKLMGDEILRRARQQESLREVPYVVFSSSDDRQDAHRCLRVGANAYATKPVDYDEYVDTVRAIARRWLGESRDGAMRTPLPHAMKPAHQAA